MADLRSSMHPLSLIGMMILKRDVTSKSCVFGHSTEMLL